MAKKSWRDKEFIAPPKQKFSWKSVGTFKTYTDASAKKASLKDKHIKIRRCGPNGTLFSVKVGTAVKPPKTEEDVAKEVG